MSKGINTGTVVYFNTRLKYGFIRDEHSGLQVYYKSPENWYYFHVGAKVHYDIYVSLKGNKLEAKNVQSAE